VGYQFVIFAENGIGAVWREQLAPAPGKKAGP
jgi:hypothetical protein